MNSIDGTYYCSFCLKRKHKGINVILIITLVLMVQPFLSVERTYQVPYADRLLKLDVFAFFPPHIHFHVNLDTHEDTHLFSPCTSRPTAHQDATLQEHPWWNRKSDF